MPVLNSPHALDQNARLVVTVTTNARGSAPIRSSSFVNEETLRPTSKLMDQPVRGNDASLGKKDGASKLKDDKAVSASETKPKKSRSKREQKKRLRFSKYDAIYDIKHINDFTDQEWDDCYMHPEDLNAIRRECCATVKEIDSKTKNKKGGEMEGYFLRGLDQHTNKYSEQKGEIRKQVYDAVFRIQDFSWNSGVDCTDLMAKASMKYSETSAVAAQMAAMSDLFSSFKGTWTQRHIPTIVSKPTKSTVTMA